MFFFHPLVVLARREERLAREAAADALALRATGAAAADYGSLLLSLSLAQAGPRPALVGAVGVIEGGSPLRRRLLALRDGAARTDARRNRWRLAVALVPLLALVFVPWQVTHGQAQPPATASASAPSGYSALPTGSKRIAGVIRDGAGRPVLGVGVQLTWHSVSQDKDGIWHEAPAGNVSTNAQGRFSFSSLPAGAFDYTITSPKERYVPIQGSLVISPTDAQKDLHLTVSTGSFVTGRVVDGRTGRPTAGVSVVAGSVPQGGNLAQWDYWTMPSGTTTDVQGYYRVHVTPGSIAVGVGRMTGNTHRIDERVREAVRKVVVRLGQTASAPDLPVFLYPMIAFTGPDGRPLANTVVRIIPRGIQQRGEVRDITTDTAGAVVLNPLRLGEQPSMTDSVENYSFSINKNNQYQSGTFQWSPGQPLVIEENGQTLNFPDGVGRVQLTAEATAVVVGHVVSGDAEPISDAVVAVYETDPKSHYGLGNHFFRTDASGDFRAPLDLDGQYHVYIRANGFNQVMVSHDPLPLVKSQATDLGTIRLVDARGFVAGRIVDPQETPMPGILASVRGDQTGNSAALTDAQGRFRIPNVVPGEALRLTLCLKGELVNGDSGSAGFQSNEQMDFSGVQASPVEREIVWHPHSGGY